ncbi:MAG: hypothetical protein JXB48_15535 [Candidatus Latescibacteria bacterium]|nr:hypothetical protein [Candidatus Latescibacterota bacterium]
MKYLWHSLCVLLVLSVLAVPLTAQGQPTSDIKQIYPKMYPAGGLIWSGINTQNTCWNKICEDPQGNIWFSGGDHWGTDRRGGMFDGRYERPWGYGNTTVCYYDPKKDEAYVAYELDRASALFSNAETAGHGKIHANIQSDSEGCIWTAGYMGSSYDHEFNSAYYPKGYAGGAVIKYDPKTKDIDYYGVPTPYGGQVAVYLDEKRDTVHGFSVDRGRYWRINYKTMELKRYETNGRFGIREMITDHNGMCYFANEFDGLTKFDPDTETFTDLEITIPGLRASVVSSKNVIYGICPKGFVWSYDTKSGKVEEFGHVVQVPDENVYTPNIALDEQWGRLYFIAGGHGVTLAGMPILTILDLKTKKFYWPGKVDIDGSYGAVVARDHKVYFGVYAYEQKNGRRVKDNEGNENRRNYLVRYDPPKNLEDLK